ncbi:MAG: outer rane autotransporter barrel domain [Proteobacteria bacterium]|nr:outer rane autotransporter barrel domain [Pseudomonadota bacterium]
MAVLAGAMVPAEVIAGDVTVDTSLLASVYGNSSGDPTVPDSSVPTSSNTLTIQAGADVISAYGAFATSGDANNNLVTLTGGTLVSELYAGFSINGSVDHNTVNVSSGYVQGRIIGGYTTNNGDATYNTVTGSGGHLGVLVLGGYSDQGNATYNAVSISGGNAFDVIGGLSEDGNANHNSVDISGGTFTGNSIIGGATAANAATDNTVTISGTPLISSGVALYGGVCNAGSCTGDLFSDNTFNLKTAGLTVASLTNFEYLNFYLPTSLAAGQTMLTVTGTADLTNGSGTSSTVNVGINGAASALAVGDSVTLIHAGTLTTTADLNDTATGSGMRWTTCLASRRPRRTSPPPFSRSACRNRARRCRKASSPGRPSSTRAPTSRPARAWPTPSAPPRRAGRRSARCPAAPSARRPARMWTSPACR